MTDATDKLFAAVREYAIDACRAEVVGLRAPFVLNYDWKPNDAARAKLLEAVDSYLVDKRLHELSTTAKSVLLLEAKARVCEAVAAWEPEENRNSASWSRVSDALRAVRELEKTR